MRREANGVARRRLIVHSRRMIAAMLCWTALQAAAAQIAEAGPPVAEAR
jgi:hypothetical protein